MIRRLTVHVDAQSDLKALLDGRSRRNGAKYAGAYIAARLQEFAHDEELQKHLLIHDPTPDRDEDLMNAKKWGDQQARRRNLWRVKFWELEEDGIRYRIFYAYDELKEAIVVLAVVHKEDIDYDNPSHPLTQRIVAAYESVKPLGRIV